MTLHSGGMRRLTVTGIKCCVKKTCRQSMLWFQLCVPVEMRGKEIVWFVWSAAWPTPNKNAELNDKYLELRQCWGRPKSQALGRIMVATNHVGRKGVEQWETSASWWTTVLVKKLNCVIWMSLNFCQPHFCVIKVCNFVLLIWMSNALIFDICRSRSNSIDYWIAFYKNC